MRTSTFGWAIAAAGLALGACATTNQGGTASSGPLDDSRLAGLSDSQLSQVHQQQQVIDQAQNDLANDQQNKQEAENRVKLAETEHDVAKARVDQAKTQVDLTQKNLQQIVGVGQQSGQTQSMASAEQIAAQQKKVARANAAYQQAQTELNASNAKIDYLKSLSDVAGRQVEYDQKNIDLQQAKLSQVKFQALAQAKPAEARAMKEQAPDYEAHVAKAQAGTAQANADLARARADANSRYKMWTIADSKVSQQGHMQMQQASVPPPPRG